MIKKVISFISYHRDVFISIGFLSGIITVIGLMYFLGGSA